LVKEVAVGQRGMGVALPTGVLWGQGVQGKRKSSGAGVRGQGAGSIIINVVNSMVDNGASIGGACWGTEARGGGGLGGGLRVMVRVFLGKHGGETGEGQGYQSFGDHSNR